MKEKCECGKVACFMYLNNDKEESSFLCEDCVPPIVKQYEYSEEGFLHWQKSNPLRGGDNEATDGI